MKHRIYLRPFLRLATLLLFLVPIYILLYKIYIPKISAFGCFDDCFNFMGGYFLGKGKTLFSEIYFNHQPLMAYISFLVQRFSNPINIYALVLVHRQTLILFSFVFQLLLCWRFGMIGVISMIIFEFTKFYTLGDRFLAEGFIVYPLLYLLGLLFDIERKHDIHTFEYIVSAAFTWFIIFMREPYIPLALFLYFLIIRQKIRSTIGLTSLFVFLFCTVILFLLFPIQEYFFNVIYINFTRAIIPQYSTNSVLFMDLLKSFFYPFYIFISPLWNENRIILLVISSIYLISMGILLRSKKYFSIFIYLFITLGLANLRPTVPGLQYYEAFHTLVWYSLFIFSTIYVFHEASANLNKRYLFFIPTIVLMLYIFFSPQSFIYQKVDSHTEFITNYGHYIGIGEVIKVLSTPNQTMFTDGNEELLYWQASRPSAYRYSFYYPSEKNSKYYKARMMMFQNNPPDFYYDFCTPITLLHSSIPKEFTHLYTQLNTYEKPSCLYIKTSIIPTISAQQWQKAKEFEYTLPERL